MRKEPSLEISSFAIKKQTVESNIQHPTSFPHRMCFRGTVHIVEVKKPGLKGFDLQGAQIIRPSREDREREKANP
jgi:hypothetical protein